MKKVLLPLAFATAVALASCATNRAGETAVSGTVFDYAYDGIPSTSYKDFLWGKDGGYSVNGPEEALGSDAADGWTQRCWGSLRSKDGEYVYIVKFLDNDETSAIAYIDIYKPNGDLFLSRYIGKSKAAVLADFPLGAGIDDREYPDELQYDAADMTIQFLLKNGRSVAQIRILPKKAADTGKRRATINADWWGAMTAEERELSRADFNEPWIVGKWRVTQTAEGGREASLTADIRGYDDESETIVSFGEDSHKTTLGWLLALFYESSFNAFDEAEELKETFPEQVADGSLTISFQRPTLSGDERTVTAFFRGEFNGGAVNRTFRMERLADDEPAEQSGWWE